MEGAPVYLCVFAPCLKLSLHLQSVLDHLHRVSEDARQGGSQPPSQHLHLL